MNLNNISATTSEKYGFKVFDWDENRGGMKGAGRCLVAKVRLRDPVVPKRQPSEAEKAHIDAVVKKIASALEAMPKTPEVPEPPRDEALDKPTYIHCQWSMFDSTEETARKLSIIYNDYREVEIEGKKFQATSIHISDPNSSDPLLFIMGNKV